MVKSYLSDKIEIKQSSIHDYGMHAKEHFKKGEVVFIKGGHVLKREQLYSSGVINSYHPIDDEYCLGATNAEEENGIKLYINHSCSPNCGLRGEITFVAIKDIEKGEELKFDYALLDNEDYSFECKCGSENCRSIVTGYDWKLQEIQNKYYDYFAAYLKEKITQGGFR